MRIASTELFAAPDLAPLGHDRFRTFACLAASRAPSVEARAKGGQDGGNWRDARGFKRGRREPGREKRGTRFKRRTVKGELR